MIDQMVMSCVQAKPDDPAEFFKVCNRVIRKVQILSRKPRAYVYKIHASLVRLGPCVENQGWVGHRCDQLVAHGALLAFSSAVFFLKRRFVKNYCSRFGYPATFIFLCGSLFPTTAERLISIQVLLGSGLGLGLSGL